MRRLRGTQAKPVYYEACLVVKPRMEKVVSQRFEHVVDSRVRGNDGGGAGRTRYKGDEGYLI